MSHPNPKHTNQLVHSTSPYLLQHAHNPVDWYPWGAVALQRAKAEDKPILISIGYAACHWCHVMERESFENEEVAAFMNAHFINIKVDREERPDLDQIYMEALTTIAGSGGWPLNCFLTPDGRPFYGGTYYPPQPMYNRLSWIDVLQRIHHAFHHRREEIEKQANQLTYHIQTRDQVVFKSPIIDPTISKPVEEAQVKEVFERLKRHFDLADGGFGDAPKFPGTMNLQWLLDYHYHTQNEEALQHLTFSLDKMIQGGIYDQLGGGFARYTVDKKWLVPHFEKMLYDNGLLVAVIAKAYKLTKKDLYRETIEHTLQFIARDMMSQEGGFYASYDADSEGVEGKFYVWDEVEIDQLLGADAALFKDFYDVSTAGNWEHQNILNCPLSYEVFATNNSISVAELKTKMAQSRQLLFNAREKRIKPGLDDKIILGWNALMCSAFAHAAAALQNDHYQAVAERNLAFMLEKYKRGNSAYHLLHTYKNGQAQFPAFLDDYALLIAAILDVYSLNFKPELLELAEGLLQFVERHFSDPNSVIFYYTPDYQADIVLRKKEFYDGATPSGNSTMAINYQRLGALLGNITYQEKALKMIKSAETALMKLPTSLGQWANAWMQVAFPHFEVAVVGKEALSIAKEIQQLHLPAIVLAASTTPNDSFSLFEDRYVEGQTLIYICEGMSCRMPVETVAELLEGLSREG